MIDSGTGKFRIVLAVVFGWLLVGWSHAGFIQDPGEAFFEARIRPLFIERCIECHSEEDPSGSLALVSLEKLLQGGEHGPALDLQAPFKSLLWEAVGRQGTLQMPPEAPLKAEEIDALRLWLERGAPWPATHKVESSKSGDRKKHWAFQAPEAIAVPEVESDAWSRNPIDRFIYQAMHQEDLKPSLRADRRSLIRRVTLDLTGLLPSSDEVETFVHDDRPDAYSRLVERLLATPAMGEQLGRDWLDVARYSDTKGYVYAREERFFVQAPAYRDWVVGAFNRDLPYDQFLRLQIAADQVAPNDPMQLAAMGFLTMGRRFLGVTHDIIDDRIDVVCRGTMGLTVSCARCHDHKYDPIPTSEYYGLYGVFQNTHERQVLLEKEDATLPSTSDQERFRATLHERQSKFNEQLLSERNAAAERVRERFSDYLLAQLSLSRYPEEGFDQILQTDDLFPSFVRRFEAWLARCALKEDRVMAPWRWFLPLAKLPKEEFARQATEICLKNDIASSKGVNSLVAELFRQAPDSMEEVAVRYGRLMAQVEASWKVEQAKAEEQGRVVEPPLEQDPLELWQVLFADDAPCVVPQESIVTTESYFDTKACENLWKLQGEVDRWLMASQESPPVAMVLIDRAQVREPRILKRGNPANKGPQVPRQFLTVLASGPPRPFAHGSGRIELANAIADPRNPLTARVWVNRIWQHHFGEGLVKTASDFGLRAEAPTHPGLLDWLANELVQQDWSTKSIQRLIVLSETYCQATANKGSPVVGRDPMNRWHSYRSLHRMRFEEYRDAWLQISGELDRKMGGKAQDLFATKNANPRRSLYGLIDRQFLDSNLRVFDFANPDLHIPKRSETLIPQQALFAMNHPFVAECSRHLIRSLEHEAKEEATRLDALFQRVLQRMPSAEERASAEQFLRVLPPKTGKQSLRM